MRVLLIDNSAEAALLKSMLEAQFINVSAAAVDRLEVSADYDLVIAGDINIEQLLAIRQSLSAPLIVVSGNYDPKSAAAMLKAGADDFVRKPYSAEELLARIVAILRRPKEIGEEILRAGDIELNMTTRGVKKQEHEVALTRKEFLLLEYLLRNKGSVLSRAEIFEHVWDMNADLFSNTIETHIFNLRKKLGPGSKLICTISGRGYKIKAE